MESIPIYEDQLTVSPSSKSRKTDQSVLNLLHPSNRFRLMFGQYLLPDDPGLENYKAAMLRNGCSEEELNLIISGYGSLHRCDDTNG